MFVTLQERKYFDSGDYALSKAGKASDVGVTNIGSQHPLPENIPHIHNTPTPGTKDLTAGSPIKEAAHAHSKSPMASEEPITGDQEDDAADDAAEAELTGGSESAPHGAVPIQSHS